MVLHADTDGRLTIANAGQISPYLAGNELARGEIDQGFGIKMGGGCPFSLQLLAASA
jgi:hypothetical protein